MPKRRTELDREAKVAEILDIAERQLTDGGAQALSVAAITRELGVAQNAVRWYFPSRAHLLVGALRRTLEGIAARKPRTHGTRQRVLWWTDELAPLHRHRAGLMAEARESEVAAAFVTELDGVLGHMLENAFRDRVDDADLPLAVATFRATVDGTYVANLSRARRHAVLRYALDRLWSD